MSTKNYLKLHYLYGELEADVKKLKNKGWLTTSDLEIIIKQFETLKEQYLKVSDDYNEEIAIQLIGKMKEIPIDTFLKQKEKFLIRFEEWKKTISDENKGRRLDELLKAKELLDDGSISIEEFKIIKDKLLSVNS